MKARNLPYEIPTYKLMLVRDSSVSSTTREATTPNDVSAIIRTYLEGAHTEHLVVILLNAQTGIIGVNTISIGDLTSAIVHPREVFKPAIVGNAASIIIGHNHPSGDPTPSYEDVSITKRLVQAGEIIGIELVDHIIIGDNGRFTSFKERGLI